MWSRSTCTERRAGALAGLAGLLLAFPALAEDWGSIEKLVMPGELIEGHAELEADCKHCHQPFRRSEQRSLCLECHEDVSGDMRSKEGFHGRSRALAVECNVCHTEHKGRAADILGLDPDTFDHSLTDFSLEGSHRAPACTECHRSETLHRDAPRECSACHGKDDPHRGQLGRDCGRCHDAHGWKRAGQEFDHDQTRFPLQGRHAEARCASCHPGQKYRETARDCASCHQLHDVHGGRFGSDCARCHDPRGWKTIGFRHERDTKFPLKGAHAQVSCEGCHLADIRVRKPPMDCVSCHREDDAHKGRFGSSCDSCHRNERWRGVNFDHEKTDFPLRGEHAAVACASCHTAAIATGEQIGTSCIACHRNGDVHHGELGERCEQCHSPLGWRKDVRFDHGLARFPLLGLHAVVPCGECHVSGRFRDTPMDCAKCHEDEFHERTLGTRCERCHNPNGWSLWRFDHGEQTDFPLEGAHAERVCRDCHKQAIEDIPQQSTACAACHERDDAHQGRYGPDCARCHVSTRWQDVRGAR